MVAPNIFIMHAFLVAILRSSQNEQAQLKFYIFRKLGEIKSKCVMPDIWSSTFAPLLCSMKI